MRRIATLAAMLLTLTTQACRTTEAACGLSYLQVSPTPVTRGREFTVEASFKPCRDGGSTTSGVAAGTSKLTVGLAKAGEMSFRPSDLDVVDANIGSTPYSDQREAFVITAVVPTDVPPGDYILYLAERKSYWSKPFIVE